MIQKIWADNLSPRCQTQDIVVGQRVMWTAMPDDRVSVPFRFAEFCRPFVFDRPVETVGEFLGEFLTLS